ncbi:putative glyoxalase superfamily protein PhnB [Nocardia transvalensis]|uniref:Putative glyoxalase superfamily protein PhnB n=1 Tax=Nocardia transvalensis TaxID=37333 RepID=A0A7W9UGL7_9NOCA|nr:VOC family protein [Nocardia transvalensis]MBB5912408.1 putative glyoxalase superfamily protein PhnB [Nocardia transvalensis]
MTETTSETSTTVTRTAAPLWPTFVYRDAPAAIEFLRTAFGFVERARYDNGAIVEHAELGWPGGGGIMLGSQREGMALCDQPPGVGSVYVVIDNPDEMYERAKAAGATITRELRDEDYGSRGFTCRDPEGVYWSFGTYAGTE